MAATPSPPSTWCCGRPRADLEAPSPTSATTPISCWPIPVLIGRWWQCGPPWASRAAPPRRPGGEHGGRVGHLDPDPALAVGPHPRHSRRWGSPQQPARAPAELGRRRCCGHGSWLGAAVQAQPGRRRLATGGGGGAANCSAAFFAGAAGVGGPARPVPGSRANLGARVPWGKVVSDGVPVLAATRLPGLLRVLPAVLGPERVAAVASQARVHFRSAA
jgi:hypothetical protein